MKLVDKPEGFDLRDKRSDKSSLGKDWGVQDALYDASQVIAGQKANDVVVVWREDLGDGKYFTHFRYAGTADCNGPALLMSGLGSMLGWAK